MFCQRCGKKLEEGEVCSCVLNLVKNNQSVQDVQNAAVSPTPPVQPTQMSDGLPAQSANALPDSKVLADAAKNAAKNIKNNFIVNEILSSLKDALISSVRLVHNSAQRTDILWMLLFVIDSIVIALCSNIIFEFILFGIFYAFDLAEEFSDFKDGLVRLGYESSELFAVKLLTIALTIVAAIIMTAMLLAVCKKKSQPCRYCKCNNGYVYYGSGADDHCCRAVFVVSACGAYCCKRCNDDCCTAGV